MKEVREDGVWWRFLDPNVSWVGLNVVLVDAYDNGRLIYITISERGPSFTSSVIHS